MLLDTSILMHLPGSGLHLEELVPILGEIKPCVPEAVRNELHRISKGRSKRSKTAALVLSYISSLPSYPGSGEADEILLRAASSKGVAIATMDAELIERVRSMGGLVITLHRNRPVLVGRDSA